MPPRPDHERITNTPLYRLFAEYHNRQSADEVLRRTGQDPNTHDPRRRSCACYRCLPAPAGYPPMGVRRREDLMPLAEAEIRRRGEGGAGRGARADGGRAGGGSRGSGPRAGRPGAGFDYGFENDSDEEDDEHMPRGMGAGPGMGGPRGPHGGFPGFGGPRGGVPMSDDGSEYEYESDDEELPWGDAWGYMHGAAGMHGMYGGGMAGGIPGWSDMHAGYNAGPIYGESMYGEESDSEYDEMYADMYGGMYGGMHGMYGGGYGGYGGF